MLKLFALLGLALACTSFSPRTAPVYERKQLEWEDVLPRIAYAESSNGRWTNSYLGPSYGRGVYHVADITVTTYNWNHWNVRRFTPHDMYTESNCREVALWHLRWTTRLFYGCDRPTNCPGWRYRVISAYNTGWHDVWYHGAVNWHYVRKVCGSNFEAWANE